MSLKRNIQPWPNRLVIGPFDMPGIGSIDNLDLMPIIKTQVRVLQNAYPDYSLCYYQVNYKDEN